MPASGTAAGIALETAAAVSVGRTSRPLTHCKPQASRPDAPPSRFYGAAFPL